MKLSLTLHNKTYSIESEYDDNDVYDLAEQFKGLLVNAGFHPSNVDDLFNLDYQWFTDEENEGNLQGHLSEDRQSKVEQFQNNMYKDRKYE